MTAVHRFILGGIIVALAGVFWHVGRTNVNHDPIVTAHGIALGLKRSEVFKIVGSPDDRERVQNGNGMDFYSFGTLEYRNGVLCRIYSNQLEVNGRVIGLKDATSLLPLILGENSSPISKVYKYTAPSKSFIVSVQYNATAIELSVPIRSSDRK